MKHVTHQFKPSKARLASMLLGSDVVASCSAHSLYYIYSSLRASLAPSHSLKYVSHSEEIEFLYEFRSYPEWQDLPVVIFSHVAAEDLKDCLESMQHLNVVAYRYKPTTSLKDLAQTINRSLLPIKA
jgi:hypothetical protein